MQLSSSVLTSLLSRKILQHPKSHYQDPSHSSTMSSTQTSQKQQTYTIPQSAMNTHAHSSDAQSLYAQGTASSKVSFSSRFGSFAKPPLSRSKSSTTGSSQTSSSCSQRSDTPHASFGGKQRKPRGAVKSIPNNKPPVTTYADLAYRYGAPNTVQIGRL